MDIEKLNAIVEMAENQELEDDSLIIEAYEHALNRKQFWAETTKAIEAAMVTHIETVKHDLQMDRGDLPPIRYWAGHKKETKCVDVKATLEHLLNAGLSIEDIAQCLASSAWKNGQIKKMVDPDLYSKLFTVEEKIVLENDKPKKQLIRVDETYLK